ncbi:hypothetical protein NFJ02_05g120940 [Pycnococcus provasolii]
MPSASGGVAWPQVELWPEPPPGHGPFTSPAVYELHKTQQQRGGASASRRRGKAPTAEAKAKTAKPPWKGTSGTICRDSSARDTWLAPAPRVVRDVELGVAGAAPRPRRDENEGDATASTSSQRTRGFQQLQPPPRLRGIVQLEDAPAAALAARLQLATARFTQTCAQASMPPSAAVLQALIKAAKTAAANATALEVRLQRAPITINLAGAGLNDALAELLIDSLAEAGPLELVRTVSLARNRISDDGALALSHALSSDPSLFPNLRVLDLSDNNLATAGADAVMRATCRVPGLEIRLGGNPNVPHVYTASAHLLRRGFSTRESAEKSERSRINLKKTRDDIASFGEIEHVVRRTHEHDSHIYGGPPRNLPPTSAHDEFADEAREPTSQIHTQHHESAFTSQQPNQPTTTAPFQSYPLPLPPSPPSELDSVSDDEGDDGERNGAKLSFEDGTTLDLSGREIDCTKAIAKRLRPPDRGRFAHVRRLDLSRNKFAGLFDAAVLGIPNTLTSLSLAGSGLEELGTNMGVLALPNLRELDLSYNRIAGDGAVAVAACAMLEVLDLSYNMLDSFCPASLISEGSVGLPELRILNLVGNSIPAPNQDDLAVAMNNARRAAARVPTP